MWSDDYGDRWRSITDGLPQTSVNVLAEHPDEGNLLFLGNEVGVFVSLDGGDRWDPLMNGLPTVPVGDIRVQPAYNDLLIGTHGRGIWVLDDIAPLEQLASDRSWPARRIFSWVGRPSSGATQHPGIDRIRRVQTSQPRVLQHVSATGSPRVRDPQLEIKILTATGAGRTND